MYSRAIYSGAKDGNRKIPCYTTQHASYNHEKTILFFNPDIEFRGEPDGFAVPHPNKVFAMGSFGYSLFRECGYREEDLYLTGSPRYDDSVSAREFIQPREALTGKDKFRVLMVCTLDVPLELDMVEAVYLASRGLEGIQLLLRSHPYKKIERHPGFRRFADRIEVTRGSLREDLDVADLVVFTFSTVAEEAYLYGKPVWQWLSLKYNGSALAEVVKIPVFSSVTAIRGGFQEICSTKKVIPAGFLTNKAIVSERLFYKNDGLNARRIAAHCVRNLRVDNN